MSDNKPFVKLNLLRYKLHETISIPKPFIRNNVQQGECLTLKPTDFDDWKPLALCMQQVFPARRDSSSTAAPANACEPIPFVE